MQLNQEDEINWPIYYIIVNYSFCFIFIQTSHFFSLYGKYTLDGWDFENQKSYFLAFHQKKTLFIFARIDSRFIGRYVSKKILSSHHEWIHCGNPAFVSACSEFS